MQEWNVLEEERVPMNAQPVVHCPHNLAPGCCWSSFSERVQCYRVNRQRAVAKPHLKQQWSDAAALALPPSVEVVGVGVGQVEVGRVADVQAGVGLVAAPFPPEVAEVVEIAEAVEVV